MRVPSFIVLVIMICIFWVADAGAAVVRLEAEKAQLSGCQVATTRAGYSGTGYVTGIDAADDRIVFTFQATAGIYELSVGYCAPYGEKGYSIAINGAKITGVFPGPTQVWGPYAAGKIELAGGTNTITIEKGWGWYDVDYIEIFPAVIKPLLPVPPKLVDPKASPCAVKLMRYLVSQYGSKTLSGQYDQYDGTEVPYIISKTGKTPAVLGGDLMDYSPERIERGADPKNHVEQMIASANQGYIVTMCWHWNAPSGLLDSVSQPWYKGFYTAATTFDVQQAIDNPTSAEYKLLLRDIDAIAEQLKKFSKAGVPVLWRPLHEAEGGWFWWGAKGPHPYIKLWKLMFNRFTGFHNLHNLIWVQNCVQPEWYPGDAYVDIVSADAYPSDVTDPLSATWDALIKRFNGKKLLALSEFGGVPDINKMNRFGVRWSFFATWPGKTYGPQSMTVTDLVRIYADPLVLNKSDVAMPATSKTRPSAVR